MYWLHIIYYTKSTSLPVSSAQLQAASHSTEQLLAVVTGSSLQPAPVPKLTPKAASSQPQQPAAAGVNTDT